nr:hypothetical protein [Paracoccus sp. J56]
MNIRTLCGQNRRIFLPLDNRDPCLILTGERRRESTQLCRSIRFATNRGRGRHQPHIFRGNSEPRPHPTQQKRHLCRLAANIAVGLIQNDPAQGTLADLKQRPVLRPQQQIFEHGDIGHQNFRRAFADLRARAQFDPVRFDHSFPFGLGCVTIQKREADPASQTRRPGREALALALDQGVQRIEQDSPHPATGSWIGQDVLQNRNQEALGLARTGACRH